MTRFPWLLAALIPAALFPFFPAWNEWLSARTGQPVGSAMPTIFIYMILALGLNVVIGNAGLLHLGIAAFFGVGAYITGILCVQENPFHFKYDFLLALALSVLGAAGLSVLLSAPVLRLRGDYLALVTLGFGEVLRFTLRNLENITNGTKGIKPIPAPEFLERPLRHLFGVEQVDWVQDFRFWYIITLLFLVAVVVLLRNIERSRLGRGWVALREDELAAGAMGLNPSRLKLAAFAIGAGLAGLAGSLYTFKQSNTADPDTYGFNTSILVLCCLILGGLGNLRGVIVGVLLIVGYENIASPALDSIIQEWKRANADEAGEVRWMGIRLGNEGSPYLSFSGWRLMIFGLVLILVMRFRPNGLLPARRGK